MEFGAAQRAGHTSGRMARSPCPWSDEIRRQDLTPEKLAANITEALTKSMNHPDVSVSVQQVKSKKYFIMGEVQKTGSFPLLIPTTVSEALVNAGGFKDFAKTKGIIIIRGNAAI